MTTLLNDRQFIKDAMRRFRETGGEQILPEETVNLINHMDQLIRDYERPNEKYTIRVNEEGVTQVDLHGETKDAYQIGLTLMQGMSIGPSITLKAAISEGRVVLSTHIGQTNKG